MEDYHSLIDSVRIKPYRHMFGGYQLMQGLESQLAEERYKSNVELWEKMKKKPTDPSGMRHVMHIEFGHFYDQDHF